MFDVENDAIIAFAVEPSGTPATPTDNSAPTWAALPGAVPTVIGYSKLPTSRRGLNNSKGRSAGLAGAAYNKRGSVTPSIGFQFAPGSQTLIPHCLRVEGGLLSQLIIYEIVLGQWARVYRGSKCGNIEFDLGANGGQGGEVMISAQFEAISRVDLVSIPAVTRAMLRALGQPLFWHDVRQLSITHADGNPYSYRGGITSAVLRCNHTLVRGVQRPFFGDNNELSLTSEEIRETDIVASGDLTLNQKVAGVAFDDLANSQNWSNLVVGLSDGPGLPVGGTAKGFSLTATRPFPSDETTGGQGTISHQIPFTADNLLYAAL